MNTILNFLVGKPMAEKIARALYVFQSLPALPDNLQDKSTCAITGHMHWFAPFTPGEVALQPWARARGARNNDTFPSPPTCLSPEKVCSHDHWIRRIANTLLIPQLTSLAEWIKEKDLAFNASAFPVKSLLQPACSEWNPLTFDSGSLAHKLHITVMVTSILM